MYISLKTSHIWEISEEFSPQVFFEAITQLLLPGDTIAIGAYNPCDQAYEWLSRHSERPTFPIQPYSDNFDLNKRKFPRGRAFNFALASDFLMGISCLLRLEQGSLDKSLFFDHLLCFRVGVPIIPLLNFHDAFNGGNLHISGLYTPGELNKFCRILNVNPKKIQNPEEGQFSLNHNG